VGDDLDNEAMLVPGRMQAIAFAVWNGENKERNGQKSVASWMQLHIDPVQPPPQNGTRGIESTERSS
jgi:hypothetical protein